ncbi:coiled-coil domain-containing protein [Streptomyces spongiae]|uniref:Uncharacterized protein n=1 Tax=Streptomyces spongiae TaxID=565072 RepID=A0A5N8XA19_9ACTN|nr:hypothetical protein [Streptomyces spongiae]MPY56350.1 hypothetical protein [Streptomyces spongiae]
MNGDTMNDEARTRMAEALEGGEDHDALRALRCSLEWSARVVARMAGTATDTEAVEAVFLLDDALSVSAELARAVPGLLAAAEPGPDVEAYLADRERELTDLGGMTRAARQEHERLARTEAQLRVRLEELDGLRTQITELRRLERLVEALDDIRAQQTAVEERLALLTRHAGGTEEAVRLGSTELLRLTEDQLTRLAGPVRETLERATTAQRELAEAEAELTEAEGRAAQASARLAAVEAERDKRLAELAARTEADRHLADALAAFDTPEHRGAEDGTVERVRALADDVERRLHDLDRALGRAMDARDRATAPGRAVIAWSDEGPAPHPVR